MSQYKLIWKENLAMYIRSHLIFFYRHPYIDEPYESGDVLWHEPQFWSFFNDVKFVFCRVC